MLLNPIDNIPFYVGKGIDNRVFRHLSCALTEEDDSNAKFDKIREIKRKGHNVKHVIVRHGLTEKAAFDIEASLIDSLIYCGILLSNKVSGHDSIEKGLMSAEEIIRLYNAQPLSNLGDDCVIININKNYKRGIEGYSIYKATKETWTINKDKLPKIKFVLSEFRGLIVEVFEVVEWYEKERGYLPTAKRYGQSKIGYGFNGVVASDLIRGKYLNKSISHLKKRGAASVIRYNI